GHELGPPRVHQRLGCDRRGAVEGSGFPRTPRVAPAISVRPRPRLVPAVGSCLFTAWAAAGPLPTKPRRRHSTGPACSVANLDRALAAAGATFRDVVKTTLYVVGLQPEHIPINREVRARRTERDGGPPAPPEDHRQLDETGEVAGRVRSGPGRRPTPTV